MKVRKIEQNTEEWFEYRKGKSGGSEFRNLWIAGLPIKSKIIEKLEEGGQPLPPADKKLTTAELAAMLEPKELAILKLESEPKKKYYELIAERVARPITPNDYIDRLNGEPFSMMARGHLLEKEALFGSEYTDFEGFEKKLGKKLDTESVVWESDWSPYIYISPDATITDEDGKVREAVEVKCLGNAETIKAWKEKTYPKEYEPQVIKYFVVNEDLEILHFILYTDTIPGLELQHFVIYRKDIADRIEDAKLFEIGIMDSIARDAEEIERLGF